MKNIIANNCVGARIYQIKGEAYNTPFVWCLVSPEDFLYLYENFNIINFKNIRIEKDGEWYFIRVDDKIKIYYPHYRYDENCNIPAKRGIGELNIYYCNIEDYIVEKYKSRLSRMTEEPLFIIDDKSTNLVDGKCVFKDSDIQKYVDKKNCIITTSNKKIRGKNVIYKTNPDMTTGAIAKIILKKTDI